MSDNSRREQRNFSNNPQSIQPIVMIDPRALGSLVSNTRSFRPPSGKRYAQCADCGKGKLFICFKGNDNACDKARDTHTHFKCECAGGRNVVFAGAVQFRTIVKKPFEKRRS